MSENCGKTLGVFYSITDLANGQAVPLGADHLHLNTIHQTLQLVPDIPGSSHGAELDEVLIAPLCGVTALQPLREKDIRISKTGRNISGLLSLCRL